MPSAVSCLRVSTGQQSKSGLGLEAQREAIARFAKVEGMTILAEHVEVETGKGTDALDRRPILREALAVAKRARVPVIVAKLDRLSRGPGVATFELRGIVTLTSSRRHATERRLGVSIMLAVGRTSLRARS